MFDNKETKINCASFNPLFSLLPPRHISNQTPITITITFTKKMSQKNPLHIPSPFQANEPDMTPEQKEQQYVHSVYQVIAPHFSATRYKVCLIDAIIFPATDIFQDILINSFRTF